MSVGFKKYDLRKSLIVAGETPKLATTGLYARYGKRVIDICIILLALPAVLPLIGLFALLIMMDGGNPFYFQERVGKGNKTFRMWKMRSMVPDAKKALAKLIANDEEARREWEESQKLKKDPRVTPIGHFIRKFSIDELPQVWNVLRGDMSLVGPRPMMPEQRALYPGHDYYSLRPGITGLWQVSERNQSSFAARSEFDTEYARTLSAKTDATIMLSTVTVVLRGTGC